ncbi:MAG: arylesterase [Rhodocyclaceae bacterium]|nr:MAG: arylesterase [Rhodocyclaceae bacterium]
MRSMLFCLCLVLSVAAHATPRVILVFGDSLSAGYGLRVEEAWPSLLNARLRSEKLDYTVVNASISGETTAGGLSRIDAAIGKHKPSVVIIALGANDGLRGLSLSAMRGNLEGMIQSTSRAGARTLLVGMRMPPNYGPDYTQKFQQSFADVAQPRQIALVPFMMDGFADRRDFFQADGIHPTAQAQPKILDTIWPALKPLLRR